MSAFLENVRAALAPAATDSTFAPRMLTLVVRPELVMDVAHRLRDAGFDLLLDITAVDWPARDPRFDVVYHFYSTTEHVRVRVKSVVPEATPVVPSLVALYGSAAFMERECREMYGIAFDGNDDLRPILLYEGFVGYPLRKDYPKEHEQPLVRYRTASRHA